MSNNSSGDPVEMVERITKLFKLERIVYIVATCIALLMLLTNAALLIINGKAGAAELSLLFGSGGLITLSLNRIIKMWSETMKLLLEIAKGKGE